MECRKFTELLKDLESSRYNVGRIEILKCYVAQSFSAEQITNLIKPMTRSKAKLQGFQLLVEEMNVCRLEEAVSLLREISINAADKRHQVSCLEELVKNKKVSLKEGEHFSLFALFQGTTSEETAAKLLNITLQNVCTKVPLSSTAFPLPPPLSQPPTPLSQTPSRTPTATALDQASAQHNSVRTTSFILPNTTNCVCENAINPTIGFVLSQETPPPPPQLHAAITQGPPPEVGFHIQI